VALPYHAHQGSSNRPSHAASTSAEGIVTGSVCGECTHGLAVSLVWSRIRAGGNEQAQCFGMSGQYPKQVGKRREVQVATSQTDSIAEATTSVARQFVRSSCSVCCVNTGLLIPTQPTHARTSTCAAHFRATAELTLIGRAQQCFRISVALGLAVRVQIFRSGSYSPSAW